jgi:hypothetical protein
MSGAFPATDCRPWPFSGVCGCRPGWQLHDLADGPSAPSPSRGGIPLIVVKGPLDPQQPPFIEFRSPAGTIVGTVAMDLVCRICQEECTCVRKCQR